MSLKMLKVENVSKVYRLGVIGSGTLYRDIQSWWALKRGREDPYQKIGETRQIKKDFFYALDNVSFEVNAGETIGIIGRNGAGKSTLLKLLTRITYPTKGRIYLNGRVSSMLEVGTGFHPEMTGRENIYMNGAILGMTKREISEKIEEIIDFSECREFIDTPVKRYSSGMYVKLAFSVAAHLDNEIVIMDEVLAVGDMAFQNKCIDRMKRIANDEGKTVLYVSHNMSTIRRLCSRCIVLEHGKVIYDGEIERAIAVYLGGEEASRMSASAVIDNSSGMKKHGIWAETLAFHGAGGCIFDSSEPLKFSLDLHCEENAPRELKLRALIHSLNGSLSGASVCELDLRGAPERCEREMKIDISTLVPGIYYLNYDIFRTMGDAYENLSSCRQGFYFEKKSAERSTTWKAGSWGSVRFPTLR